MLFWYISDWAVYFLFIYFFDNSKSNDKFMSRSKTFFELFFFFGFPLSTRTKSVIKNDYLQAKHNSYIELSWVIWYETIRNTFRESEIESQRGSQNQTKDFRHVRFRLSCSSLLFFSMLFLFLAIFFASFLHERQTSTAKEIRVIHLCIWF